MSQKYLFSGEVCDAITLAHKLNVGCLLHGPSGHAKTSMTREIVSMLEYPDSDVQVIPFGDGTLMASVLGGLQIQKFTKEGELLYMPERSWMSKKVVIMEEFLDAPPPILEQLKYILSERKFPQYGSTYNLDLSFFVACTNHDPIAWCGDNNSRKGVISRFPLVVNVKWPEYTVYSYQTLFQKQLGQKFEPVCEALELCVQHGKIVSPKDAITIARTYGEYQTLSVFAFHLEVGADKVLLEDIIRQEHKVTMRVKARELMKTITEKVMALPKPAKGDDVAQQNALNAVTQYLNYALSIQVDDKLVKEANDLVDSLRKLKAQYEKHVTVPEEWKI